MFIIQLFHSDDLILYYILHSYKCYQLILIIEFVPKIKNLWSCFSSDFAFPRFKVSVTNNLLCDILLSLIPFWSNYLSSRWMLFSNKQSYNQVNWNYMAKSRCQCNIFEFLEKIVTFSSFICFFLLLFSVDYLEFIEQLKLIKYPIHENVILI